VTRHLSSEILSGITRTAVLRLCDEEGLTVEERAFSLDEALAATEAFVTSASTLVWPVVKIDGAKIGDGRPGRIASRLRAIYLEQAMAAD
jgi:D-alanine transaminase